MTLDVVTNIESEIVPQLEKLDIDLRRAKRAVAAEFADEFVGNLRSEFQSRHHVTGDTLKSIRRKPKNGGNIQHIRGSEVIWYVDEGTPPHPVSESEVEDAADQHGMPPFILADIIEQYGTQQYNVIEAARERTEGNAQNIIDRVLREKGII
jgi:hypothetical protein